MLQISGQKILRDGEVVGYIENIYIKDHSGNKVGYFENNYVYDASGKKVAYVEGEYLYDYANSSSYTELDKINKAVKGDVLPEIARCAVYQLIGA